MEETGLMGGGVVCGREEEACLGVKRKKNKNPSLGGQNLAVDGFLDAQSARGWALMKVW